MIKYWEVIKLTVANIDSQNSSFNLKTRGLSWAMKCLSCLLQVTGLFHSAKKKEMSAVDRKNYSWSESIFFQVKMEF